MSTILLRSYAPRIPIRLFHDFTFDFTSCKYGKLFRQFPECMSFLAPSQTTLQANFKDDGFCGSIFAFSIDLRAGRSFAVRRGEGVAILRKLRIFSNLPPLLTNLILSCSLPDKFYPPPPRIL